MNRKFLLIIVLIFLPLKTISQKLRQTQIKWSVWSELPIADGLEKQVGLAGASSGLSNDVMLIVGGSNFEDGVPWRGGQKKYFNDIYVVQKDGKNFVWAKKTYKLPFNLAYAATVSTPRGLVCIGGENENGISPKVILLNWNDKKQEVDFNFMPDLPCGITNASAIFLDNKIFVLGGETKSETLSSVYQLNVNSGGATWQKLMDLPLPLSHSVAVIQSNNLFLFGGRAKTESGISKLSNRAFRFDLKKNKWETIKNIADKNIEIPALSAGVGVALGKDKILLIGGDKGNIFSQIEMYNAKIIQSKDENEKSSLQKEKVALLENHQGFSKDIYVYDIRKNSWTKFGEMPMITPVTTNLVKWGDVIFIPSGEIKPGIRTPNILIGKIIK
ncbi:kelch repeat-containing protein [Emticicia aquatilis]|uniref:kelch repeat-containing protein n=1 Tax=Emticicia aquatilis TaxID=1537369 RepID=UPI001669EFF5|nr:kelch repeat-containing protein [Emticicia aquatilis]